MRVLVVCGMTLLVAWGCSPQTEPSSPGGSVPPVPTAVGPAPGPNKTVPAPANPLAGNAVAVQEGRRLFVQMNCSGCHGGRAGGGMGPSLRDPDWIYGSSDAQIFDSIAEGRAKGMPAWGTRLPSDQIWRLVAYIKTLGTANEPDPPSSFP
jgi:cytochrome c oxidase cbb3-type subunit III